MPGAMDPFSAFASALALAKFLLESLKLGRKCVDELRNRSVEAARITLQMSLALDRGEALHNLMFGASSSGDASSELGETRPSSDVLPIFSHLRHKTATNVVAIVNQYHDLIHSRYRSLRQIYLLEVDMAPSSSSLSFQRIGALPQQLSWMLRGKRILQSTVDDCDSLNERLTEIIQLYFLEKAPIFSAASGHNTLVRLKSDRDVLDLGLDDEIRLLRIAADENQDWGSLEVGAVEFTDAATYNRNLGMCEGRYVLVEFKKFPLGNGQYRDMATEGPPDPVVQRIRQLAALLHQHHSIKSRLLRCHGLYLDLERSAYGFVFQYPDGRSKPPKSLWEILSLSKSRRSSTKPPLETRLSLALTLAVALFQFHAVGWVHKSVRSDNIVFFPKRSDSSISEGIEEPWLTGFEYAREDEGFSEKATGPDFDPAKDLYRHPETWGQPTVRFDKQHDVYSLGVVLLEVGLWQPIQQLDRHSFEKAGYDDRFDIQALFLQRATETLPFLTGSQYASIVTRCLSGSFSHGTETEIVDKAELFRDHVMGPLRRLAAQSTELQPLETSM